MFKTHSNHLSKVSQNRGTYFQSALFILILTVSNNLLVLYKPFLKLPLRVNMRCSTYDMENTWYFFQNCIISLLVYILHFRSLEKYIPIFSSKKSCLQILIITSEFLTRKWEKN